MDLNELQGRVIKVNLARPMKTPMQLGGNRAGKLRSVLFSLEMLISFSLGIRRMA